MGIEITRSLEEEYQALREHCSRLKNCARKDKRREAEALLPAVTAHTLAEEEVLFSRALDLDDVRPAALKALEEHELAESELLRLWQSVDEEQFAARAEVVCDLLDFQWRETEARILPLIRQLVPEQEREEMGLRYRETKERHRITRVLQMPERGQKLASGN